jgi:sterol desaturase/sphingolipid hydroxylase (fatty acid hydroxylase superfamily)
MELLLPVLFSALAMTLIVGVRYLISSGLFAWISNRKHAGIHAGLEAQIKREIGWSLASAGIYGIPAGVVAWGWQNRGWSAIYSDVSDWPLWYVPLSVALFLAAHDTWFYWTHRLMHRPWWFKTAHAVHHASRPPTAWAAMSFHPWEALTGAIVIPALVFLIPIHIGALGLVLLIMTLMGISNHMGWEMFPDRMVNGPLGSLLITATHHQRHHDDYRGNYGLYFRFWDRLCGTDLGLGTFRHSRDSGKQPSHPASELNA